MPSDVGRFGCRRRRHNQREISGRSHRGLEGDTRVIGRETGCAERRRTRGRSERKFTANPWEAPPGSARRGERPQCWCTGRHRLATARTHRRRRTSRRGQQPRPFAARRENVEDLGGVLTIRAVSACSSSRGPGSNERASSPRSRSSRFIADFLSQASRQCLAPACEVCLHGARAAPQYLGNLGDGSIVEVVQRDHRPLPAWQTQQRLAQIEIRTAGYLSGNRGIRIRLRSPATVTSPGTHGLANRDTTTPIPPDSPSHGLAPNGAEPARTPLPRSPAQLPSRRR